MYPSTPKPTAKAGLAAVQGIHDLCQAIRRGIKTGEHERGKHRIEKTLARLDAEADELRDDLAEMFPDDGFDEPEYAKAVVGRFWLGRAFSRRRRF